MELSSGPRRRAPGCGFWLTRGVADLPGRSHGIIRFKCLPSLSDRFGLRVDGRVSLISTQKAAESVCRCLVLADGRCHKSVEPDIRPAQGIDR